MSLGLAGLVKVWRVCDWNALVITHHYFEKNFLKIIILCQPETILKCKGKKTPSILFFKSLWPGSLDASVPPEE